METDAYATGEALVALHESGGMPVTRPGLPQGIAVPALHAERRRFLAREDTHGLPGAGEPAVPRDGLPVRPRPVHLRGGNRLRRDGADAVTAQGGQTGAAPAARGVGTEGREAVDADRSVRNGGRVEVRCWTKDSM